MVSREPVGRDEERVSWGARILAPVAFFAAATVLIVIVNNSLSREEERASPNASPPAATGSPPTTTGATTARGAPTRRRFYRIQEGDTLEALAQRFNTTVDDLLRLNPGIDANALTPGQRIRIR
jgi:LysM repeat protein